MQRPYSRFRLPRLWVALTMSLGLTAAGAQETVDSPPEPAASAPTTSALPNQALTPEILYLMLMSEVAGARGNLDVAAQGYIELARKTQDPRIAQRAAEVAIAARRAPEALEAARLWVKEEPESEPAIQMLAGLLAGGMGKLAELEPLLGNLLARHTDRSGGLLMSLNRTLNRYPDKAEVRASVDRLTEPYLLLPEAHFARAHAAFNAGDSNAALSELNQALKVRPDWEPAAVLKAQLLQQQSGLAAALAFLKEFVAQQPAARDVRYAYARLLAVDRQYPVARVEFEKLVKEVPDNPDVGYTYALLLLQAGEKAAAEKEFLRVLKLERADQDTIRLQLAQLYEEEKRIDDAIEMYRSLSGPKRTTGLARAALLQARNGDLSGARVEFEQLRADNPKEATVFFLAEAQILREQNHVQEAFDLLGAALKKQPDQPDLLYDYALLAERLDKVDVMEQGLRKLIALKPDEAQAYNALGYSFADRNLHLDEAKKLISKALELAPDDSFILDSMGWVLYRTGDLQGARAHLQRAFAARPDPEIAAHLGEVLWMLGEKQAARALWEESLRQHPESEELSKVMQRFAE